MLLITKELAEAVVRRHLHPHGYCGHCMGGEYDDNYELIHDDNCVVIRAKLLLEQEWGIKS